MNNKHLSIILSACCLLIGGFTHIKNEKKPLFFDMQNEYEQVVKSKEVLRFTNKDTLIEHQLELLLDQNEQPLMFFASINTPVCIDNICKPMDIEIYWNLIGGYVGYGILEQFPLTKFDHDLFEPTDYEKLHHLLLDRHSILERKEMSDLFDPNAQPEKQVTFQGVKVDAMTGATKKEIKESVVEGALYSCYTIWHLVHGGVEDSIKQYLKTIYTPELAHRFLYSDYQTYQLYALKQMNKEAFNAELPRLVEIFQAAKPLIRTYILKKIPDSIWQNEEISKGFFETFPLIDINSRTLLIKKLDVSLNSSGELLVPQIEKMSRNQLKLYLDYLNKNENRLKSQSLSFFRETVEKGTYAYAYMLEEFLEEYER